MSSCSAIDDIIKEAFSYLHTVLVGRKRCGTLLVCGKSGTAGSGCGKTSILKLVGRKAMKTPYHAFIKWLDCTLLRGKPGHVGWDWGWSLGSIITYVTNYQSVSVEVII